MSDYIVYHKKEKMGYPAIDVEKLAIYTSKPIDKDNIKDSRIWLVAGEGSPRTYHLRAMFRIHDVTKSDKPDFKLKITGQNGRLFEPMPKLCREKWFPRFKKSQGNFAFGFSKIKDSEVVNSFESIYKANGI